MEKNTVRARLRTSYTRVAVVVPANRTHDVSLHTLTSKEYSAGLTIMPDSLATLPSATRCSIFRKGVLETTLETTNRTQIENDVYKQIQLRLKILHAWEFLVLMSTASAYEEYPPPGGYDPPPPGPGGPTASPAGHSPHPEGYFSPPAAGGLPTTQQQEWMSIPRGISNCPPGLQYLSIIDQLLIKQKVELPEDFTGFETNNKYLIQNSMGQTVYYVVEETGDCMRYCCGPSRGFDMKIFDHSQNEVMHLYRPLRCYLESIDIFAPVGQLVGRVKENWSLCTPSFSILNESDVEVLKIKGPCCTCRYCQTNAAFKILALDGKTQVGNIFRQEASVSRQALTNADDFGIKFSMDLDVVMKAVMLGAVFLIDFMFFENQMTECLEDCHLCLSGFHI